MLSNDRVQAEQARVLIEGLQFRRRLIVLSLYKFRHFLIRAWVQRVILYNTLVAHLLPCAGHPSDVPTIEINYLAKGSFEGKCHHKLFLVEPVGYPLV